MKKFELVIAGGGLAAAHAIKSFRESGGRGLIALLSKESYLPTTDRAVEALPARRDNSDSPRGVAPFYLLIASSRARRVSTVARCRR
jgi:hypothetical protein